MYKKNFAFVYKCISFDLWHKNEFQNHNVCRNLLESTIDNKQIFCYGTTQSFWCYNNPMHLIYSYHFHATRFISLCKFEDYNWLRMVVAKHYHHVIYKIDIKFFWIINDIRISILVANSFLKNISRWLLSFWSEVFFLSYLTCQSCLKPNFYLNKILINFPSDKS